MKNCETYRRNCIITIVKGGISMSEKKQVMKPQQRRGGPMGGPMGGGPMAGGTEKANNFKGTMKKLLKYLSKYNLAIVVVIIFAAASAIFSIVGPKILGKATTKLYEGIMNKVAGTGSGVDFNYIGQIAYYFL